MKRRRDRSNILPRLGLYLLALLLAVVGVLAGLVSAQEGGVIEDIQIHGNRRIPAENIRARISTRAGDVYDPASLERDFNALWNTGFFDDIRIEREESAKGWIINIYVKEKPTIRTIDYEGLNAVSKSDVLDRFKASKVGLSVESQYDPTKVKRAEVVLKELEGEHGRQFATVKTEIRPIPPAAVGVTFVVKEGPKVKVGKISFTGNKNLSSRELKAAMKNLHPIGIPHSIFLEDLFSKTYDVSKLTEDSERVRDAYQQKGYFKAAVEDPQTKIRDSYTMLHIPFFQSGKGKAVDITMPIEEGERYHLQYIHFKGNKAINNEKALRSVFQIKDGDIFDTSKIRDGLKNLNSLYSELGYINFTPVPNTGIDEEKKMVSIDIDIDEGKQFFVRRIEFEGNTTTRDKVIRRELAVEEGQIYNSKRWEFSILRLNQLGYFDQLKADQDTVTKKNEHDGTVDLTLKVKEKGKNQIGLTGGVSGLSGGFIGVNYSTNNLFGLGETLSVTINGGNHQRNISFGFTEPYLFDKPIQYGFTVFDSEYEYNQAQQVAVSQGQTSLNVPTTVLNTLQNYSQSTTGFTTSVSYTLRHSLKRVGLTYSFDKSTIKTFNDATQQLFEALEFRNLSGPNALEGVLTSKIIPSLSYSTIDSPIRPHSGHSFFVGGEIAGLGGDVRDIRPITEYKRFIPLRKGRNILGFRIQGSFITGYGGLVAPPFERFYLGGDTDLRGFDTRSLSPYVFVPDKVNFTLLNPDGSAVPVDPSNPRRGNIVIPLPIARISAPGGDTSIVTNLEYRIPIIGPVAVAAFVDTGMVFAARESELKSTPSQVTSLNGTAFGCPSLTDFVCSGTQSLTFAPDLHIISGTNYQPRMSTGLELQVLAPVINQPFRVYWAYNPLRLDETVNGPNQITRAMFPPGAAGDFSYRQALSAFSPSYLLREPRNTFRFTVATTF